MTMWTYSQTSGDVEHDSVYEGRGYSGHGHGVNQPDLEDVARIGPIPRGVWAIGPAHDEPHLGPCVMALTPALGAYVFGRSGFFIHGDNSLMNDSGSEGCIVLGHSLRQAIAASSDRLLTVTL